MKAYNLDEINNERVNTTLKRVAHAITILDNPVACLAEDRIIDNCVEDIAHAINLLEAAEEEMRWACKHFEWNDSICDQINHACMELGKTIALILRKDEDDDLDSIMIAPNAESALTDLSKALATLIRWFDDDVNVSEV